MERREYLAFVAHCIPFLVLKNAEREEESEPSNSKSFLMTFKRVRYSIKNKEKDRIAVCGTGGLQKQGELMQ